VLPDLTSELLTLKQKDLQRRLHPVEGPHEPVVRVDGKEVLLFCSNNYLGLASDPRVKQAAIDCLTTAGVSAPASRLISGHTSAHAAAESRIAQFLSTEAAILFPSGYSANLGVIPTLVGQDDVIFSDRLNHRSLIDGCRLSRARVVVYEHLNVDDLSHKLSKHTSARRRLIVTDGVFSMDGDLAPLDRIAALSREHDAILMVDDAHGTGIFGEHGRGTPEHYGVSSDVDVWMISASKGLGTFGGAIAGSQSLIDLIVNRSAPFIYTTAIPPDICAATTCALNILDTEPHRQRHLLDLSQQVRSGLGELGFDICGSQSHIIPVLLGDPQKTLDIADFLFDRGIFVLGIRPPTVPDGMSRLRLSLMASHTDAHIERLLGTMVDVRTQFDLGTR
jgi:8-amino-7-oxononanoate synthase